MFKTIKEFREINMLNLQEMLVVNSGKKFFALYDVIEKQLERKD